MADVRLPASHWAARLTILFVLSVLVFTAAVTGAATGVAQWAVDCGGRVTGFLWAPLLDTGDPARPAPRPVSGCFHRDG